MKKTKIIVMVMALALLVGALIGIAANAAESTTPEIVAKNIRYGENLKFRIAVDGDALGADKIVTVNFYDADPETGALPVDSAVATYTDTSDKSKFNLDVDHAYIAVSNYGISAIAYGQTFYITAECDGEVSEVLEYSAVEYFLERLYADADSITEIQKKHYENAIAYGSTAQLVTGDTKTNVADYIYVMAQDGKVNGSAGAVAVKGDALNFTYTGAEDVSGLAYWLDPNGDKAAAATVSGIYTPRFADFTFNDLSTTATFTPSTMSSTGLKAVTVADGEKDVSKYAGLLYGNIGATGRIYSYSVTEDGRLKYATPQGGTEFALVNTKNVESGHNYSVFESDIQIDLGEGKTNCLMTCGLMQTSSSTMYRFIMNYKASSGNLEMYFQRNQTYSGVSYKDTSHVEFNVAEKNASSASYKFKVEQYYIAATADTVCVISINDTPFMITDTRAQNYETDCPTTNDDVAIYRNSDGVYVLPFVHYAKSASDDTPNFATTFKGISINPNSGYICDIYFDNIIYEASVVETVPTFNIAR